MNDEKHKVFTTEMERKEQLVEQQFEKHNDRIETLESTIKDLSEQVEKLRADVAFLLSVYVRS